LKMKLMEIQNLVTKEKAQIHALNFFRACRLLAWESKDCTWRVLKEVECKEITENKL